MVKKTADTKKCISLTDSFGTICPEKLQELKFILCLQKFKTGSRLKVSEYIYSVNDRVSTMEIQKMLLVLLYTDPLKSFRLVLKSLPRTTYHGISP